MAAPPPPPLPAPLITIAGAIPTNTNKAPQEIVSDFWDKFFTKKPGKVTSVFPRSLYKTLLAPETARGVTSTRNAQESYEAAAKECREKVKRIVRECNRTNEKFTDPDFDIESDSYGNCLNGLIREDYGSWKDESSTTVPAWQLKDSLETLNNSKLLGEGATVPVDIAAMRDYVGDGGGGGFSWFSGGAEGAQRGARGAAPSPGPVLRGEDGGKAQPKPKTKVSKKGVQCGEWYNPGSIHRVDWIFDSPQFTIDGYTASDIKQGGNGDCWWLAAVATIAHRKDLMAKVCVARDEECGVYGFVFHRDGEWVSTVVDDNLYLRRADFDYYGDSYDSTGKRAKEYRKRNQTGSDALYFAKCADQNETWLPLLEKAYAKVHGDYEAISGGWSGEAVEDMTGGVTTTVASNRVLKKNKLWKELVNADGEFVFALSALGTGWDWKKGGLALGHAYSILKATEEVDEEGNKVRLVQIRNPWGERSRDGLGEWNGAWSDGSKEWNAYWLKKLNHTFGDDGLFWMSYEDMLQTFMFLHRTRLFDEKWAVIQDWTSVNVGWVTGYLQSKFVITVTKAGTVVIVLCQLDDRYYHGFEGQYDYSLHFVLQEQGGTSGDHLCRVRPVHDWENRTVSCELDLEPGVYEVVPKVTADRNSYRKVVEDVVKEYSAKNPQKLRQVGMQYDLAHSKGGIADEDLELLDKGEKDKKKKEEKKKKAAEKKKKQKERERKAKRKAKEAAKKARAAERQAEKEAKEKEALEKEEQEKEKAKAKADEVKPAETTSEAATEKKTAEDVAAIHGESPKDGKDDKESAPSENIDTPTSSPIEKKEEEPEKKTEDKKVGEAKTAEDAPPAVPEPPTATSAPAAKEDDSDDDDSDDDDDDDDEEESDKEDEIPAQPEEGAPPPWNAVCVLGLRVYSLDANTSIKLEKPKNPEEAASLAVDGEPAGATM